LVLTIRLGKTSILKMRILPYVVFLVCGFVTLLAETEMVTVEGGKLPGYLLNPHSSSSKILGSREVSAFQIGKYEVTWKEWQEVRDWAVKNGYTDLQGVGRGESQDHPVIGINWYDAVKWCNAKSEFEGLAPVYSWNGTVYKTGDFGKYDVDVESNALANGYRLPTPQQALWAKRGGITGQGYPNNQGESISKVGDSKPNGIGIYDLLGNVQEWFEKSQVYPDCRLKGCGAVGDQPYDASTGCALPRDGPHNRHKKTGLRLSRNAP